MLIIVYPDILCVGCPGGLRGGGGGALGYFLGGYFFGIDTPF